MGSDRGNYRRTILELVLVTAIFAVVSVFILKIYLTADRLQADAVAISTAAVQSESIAEAVKRFGVEDAAMRFGMEAGRDIISCAMIKIGNMRRKRKNTRLCLLGKK